MDSKIAKGSLWIQGRVYKPHREKKKQLRPYRNETVWKSKLHNSIYGTHFFYSYDQFEKMTELEFKEWLIKIFKTRCGVPYITLGKEKVFVDNPLDYARKFNGFTIPCQFGGRSRGIINVANVIDKGIIKISEEDIKLIWPRV